MPEIIRVAGLTNAEFFERHAAPGRIGLVGGSELSNRLILRAQRHLHPGRAWGRFSHAFLFQGRRADGHHWIVESDLDIRKKHIRLGVQENRVAKYHGDEAYPFVAILDFGLTPAQEGSVLAAALEQVVAGTRYSLREIVGTLWALRHPEWRPRANLLARERAFYCSAFVAHALAAAGVKLAPGIDEKNTAPEHIAHTAAPHTQWQLRREALPAGRVKRVVRRLGVALRRGGG